MNSSKLRLLLIAAVAAAVAYADGHRVPAKVGRGRVTFSLFAQVGSPAEWAVELRR